MKTARYFLAVGVLGAKLYIVGGVDKKNASLACAECYDSVTGSWTQVASMSQKRYGCGAGVLNGKLYVVGGTVEKNGDYLDSVERYDPVNDSWEVVAPMSTSRYCCGVAVINGQPRCPFSPVLCAPAVNLCYGLPYHLSLPCAYTPERPVARGHALTRWLARSCAKWLGAHLPVDTVAWHFHRQAVRCGGCG
jgi:hypothetical protein